MSWNQKKKSYSEQLREEREMLFGKNGNVIKAVSHKDSERAFQGKRKISQIDAAQRFVEFGDQIKQDFINGSTYNDLYDKYGVKWTETKKFLLKHLGRDKYEQLIIGRMNKTGRLSTGSLRSRNKTLSGHKGRNKAIVLKRIHTTKADDL